MKPLTVTVIIPAHNRAADLERSVPSVLNQAEVLELLVVDDGSTDRSREIIENFRSRDPRIQYFYQNNSGPSSARNFGIRNAQAPFVAFLDSDDEWLPGKLTKQLDFFKQNPEFLICQTEEIWIRNGKRVNPMKKHQKFGGHIFEQCLPLSIVSPSCVMMKREFFDRVGMFDESLPACEDYDLWLRTSARFPIGLIDEPHVIKYGGHPDQRSREFPVMDQFRIKSLVQLIESDILSDIQKEQAVSELIRKCRIVQKGSLKRDKMNEAKYYEQLMEKFLTSQKP